MVLVPSDRGEMRQSKLERTRSPSGLLVQSRHLHQLPQNQTHIFSLLNYGAIGDGVTDDSQKYLCMAFQEAWNIVCNSSLPSPVLYVPPHKTFLLHPLVLNGPCKSNNVQIEILGNMVAPSDPSEWQCESHENTYHCPSWLEFNHVNDLYITGGEGDFMIDGRGQNWWNLSCHKTMFVIRHSNNVHIGNLNIVNSPNMHMFFQDSTLVYAYNINISSPGTSPNTDGIHIQHSQNVFVYDSHISTGDDCISIADGSSYLNIDTISCGPGHGISIGSLGIGGETETVENVHVSNVNFSGTSNGVRIKTWQGSSAVKVSNVTYNQIYGTSNGTPAIKFDCSEIVPCTDIVLSDIDISSPRKGKEASAFCRNVHGRAQGQVVPMVPCLDLSASLSNYPSGAGVVPTKSSSSFGADLIADLMLRHKNLLYGGEEDRLTIIFLLRNFLIRRMPLRLLGTCIIA
ncbi:hypothetical protein NE237_019706 [Protea cynaroides]|uniref:Polygalacturonase n=1 Tax=Protea cynaroides TaxID=273540 RepID=A0A9Q0H4M2_9MAGN|nr:hypothetical protein NE237_019706 [Protea cynaroides]